MIEAELKVEDKAPELVLALAVMPLPSYLSIEWHLNTRYVHPSPRCVYNQVILIGHTF